MTFCSPRTQIAGNLSTLKSKRTPFGLRNGHTRRCEEHCWAPHSLAIWPHIKRPNGQRVLRLVRRIKSVETHNALPLPDDLLARPVESQSWVFITGNL